MMSPLVDIEFAHFDLAPPDIDIEEREVVESAAIARAVIEGLNYAHIAWTTSVLIDDKRTDGPPRELDAAMLMLSRLIGPVPVHRAMMETSLTQLKSEFIALFDRRRGLEIEKDFRRYQVTKDGRLGCSQDIAVWAAVRLNLISSSVISSQVPTTARFGFSKASAPHYLITILPERYRPYEDRASTEILKWLDGGRVLRSSIHIYFSHPSQLRTRTWQSEVADAIKRISKEFSFENGESRP